jgi:hypothetical protein
MEGKMQISARSMTVGTFVPLMESFAAILDKAMAWQEANEADLVQARLAPDMYPLAQQVQIFCHMAEDSVLRLTGSAPIGRAPMETTLEGLKEQIEGTLARIRDVPESAFEEATERHCTIALPGDMEFDFEAAEFLRLWALPHFYFHVVTAYDILRAQGLEIGKPDFVSKAGYKFRPKAASA